MGARAFDTGGLACILHPRHCLRCLETRTYRRVCHIKRSFIVVFEASISSGARSPRSAEHRTATHSHWNVPSARSHALFVDVASSRVVANPFHGRRRNGARRLEGIPRSQHQPSSVSMRSTCRFPPRGVIRPLATAPGAEARVPSPSDGSSRGGTGCPPDGTGFTNPDRKGTNPVETEEPNRSVGSFPTVGIDPTSERETTHR